MSKYLTLSYWRSRLSIAPGPVVENQLHKELMSKTQQTCVLISTYAHSPSRTGYQCRLDSFSAIDRNLQLCRESDYLPGCWPLSNHRESPVIFENKVRALHIFLKMIPWNTFLETKRTSGSAECRKRTPCEMSRRIGNNSSPSIAIVSLCNIS